MIKVKTLKVFFSESFYVYWLYKQTKKEKQDKSARLCVSIS